MQEGGRREYQKNILIGIEEDVNKDDRQLEDAENRRKRRNVNKTNENLYWRIEESIEIG